MNEREIFAAALEQPTDAERQAFLNEVCDDDVRQRIERLLKEQAQLGSFLDHPPQETDSGLLCEISQTRIWGDGSTFDDEREASSSGGTEMQHQAQVRDDEIVLGFLEPATREGTLGCLGHYEVLEVIGKGSFGTVLRSFDTKLERIVAIKILAPEMASMSPARKRFLREARTSAQIRHENVVTIHSVEEAPIPYLVMEYIPGRTLQQQLDQHGPLNLSSVLRLGRQIADGLAAAHTQGLIHRDIKPGNILLEGDLEERIKITDFGLARTVDDASMTQSGMISGTPMYMAPEQARGLKLDQRADLFSFGSVLYQMLSGRPPFRAPSTMAVLKRVTEDTPRPIQEIIPEVPAWMCELVGHLHAKDPAQRYSSAKEVSEILATCAKELEAGRIPQIPDPVTAHAESKDLMSAVATDNRSRSRLHSPLVKIAAGMLILFGVLGITEATGVTHLASIVIRPTTVFETARTRPDSQPLPLDSQPGNAQVWPEVARTPERAISFVESLGGKVVRDDKSPGKPVTVIQLAGTQVTDAGLKELAPLTELGYLDLSGCTHVTDAGLKELAPLTNLYYLNLSGSQVTDTGLKELAPLTKLSSLCLLKTQVTDVGIQELAPFTNLEILDLNGLQVSDAGLKKLATFTKLGMLVLSSTQVTDAGLKELAPLPKLRRLELSDTEVTDVGLKELAPLTKLEFLTLDNTQVTDAELKELAPLTSLTYLTLRGTNVTDAGVKELQKALPKCQIVK